MVLTLGNKRRHMGEWLRERRHRTGKSAVQVGKETGLGPSRIKRIEMGYDRISPFRLYDFSLAYGVSFDELMDKVFLLEPELYREFQLFVRQMLWVMKSGSSFGRQLAMDLDS